MPAAKQSKMGGGGTKGLPPAKTPEPYDEKQLPYVVRQTAIGLIQAHLKQAKDKGLDSWDFDEWYKRFKELIKRLRKVLLLEEIMPETKDFVLDKTSYDLVHLLENFVTMDEKDLWISDPNVICITLMSHVSPPSIEGKIPDVRQTDMKVFTLINVFVRTSAAINGINTLLSNNINLWRVDLSYCGIDTEQVRNMLPILAKLRNLKYLGLRGNQINKSIIPDIVKMLKKKSVLPRLSWLDLSNNIDIAILPDALVTSLRQRWPKDHPKGMYGVSCRDLADEKIVVSEHSFKMNV